uniref:Asparagine-linked glycosylation 14 n=1 Tax=Mus musculus TaxID=10090 RepID=A0A0G2JF20_MOUSE
MRHPLNAEHSDSSCYSRRASDLAIPATMDRAWAPSRHSPRVSQTLDRGWIRILVPRWTHH